MRSESAGGAGAAVLRGVAAVLTGLGAGELVAGVLPPHASPLAAVAGFLVDVAPAWAKETAIAWFGTGDKLVLILAVVVVLAGLGAAAGLAERSRPGLGALIVTVLGIAGLVAAMSRGGAIVAAIPAVAGTIAGVLAIRLLPGGAGTAPVVEPVAEPPAAPAAEPMPVAPRPGPSRRAFLAWVGGTAAAGALAAVAGTAMSGVLRAGAAVAAALRLPIPARTAPPIPAAAELGVPGLAPVVTPNGEFYRVDTAFVVPAVPVADWRLRIHGLVEQEVELGWDELTALGFGEYDVTLMCVSNPVGGPYTGNARWLGTPIRALLQRAAPSAEADMVLSTSVDGWTASTPLDALLDPERDAILAVGMNGEPLPDVHGGPVRMVVPGLYGYVSATKWVVDLEVTRFDRVRAYWTDRGWAERGPVKLQSRIDTPRPSTLTAGPVPIAGVAWHQHVGIERVEVRIDDEPWRQARLAEAIGIDTWVQWVLDWDAPPGDHRIAVRATNRLGEVQTEEVGRVDPDGATGHHTIDVRVV